MTCIEPPYSWSITTPPRSYIGPRTYRSIYAAGPIDAVSETEAQDWQHILAGCLPEHLIFSPAHPYFNASFEHAAVLDQINRAAIRSTDITVAYLPAGRTAFGTLREIEYAKSQDKVVIVVAEELKSFLKYDLVWVTSLGAAAEHIRGL